MFTIRVITEDNTLFVEGEFVQIITPKDKDYAKVKKDQGFELDITAFIGVWSTQFDIEECVAIDPVEKTYTFVDIINDSGNMVFSKMYCSL